MTTLIGRAGEIDTLRSAVRRAGAGVGQVVIVEGEAGIGKTRLVQEALGYAREQGFQVLAGACDDLERTRPFAAMTQALAVTATSPDPERAAIAELLSREDSNLSSRSASPPPGIQFRVVEGLGAIVERRASDGPVILTLEDLHWADTSTLIALRSIARRTEQLPVVVVGTCRPGHEAADLHRVIDDLLRAGATRLSLGPLDEKDVEALVAELLEGDHPSNELLERLQGATGNPLFVTEYVRAISEDGAVQMKQGVDDVGVPLEFRLSVLRRLGYLSEATKNTVRLASVLGSTFSPSDLSIALGKPSVELTSSLQEAIEAGVIGERGERLAFRHDLVRDAVYEHIPLAVRRQLHRDAGRSLAAAGAGPLVVAHHLSLGAEAEDAEAADWLRRAAREAAPRAPAVAVELLERARDVLPRSSADREGLLAELVMSLAWSGRLADAEALGLEVLARRPGPEVAGAIRCGLVYALTWQGRPTEALRHTVIGPDERISDWDAALLRAEAAVASVFAFDFKTAASLAAEAAEEAERLGHELALCHALTVQTWAALFAGRPADAAELGLRAVDIADRSTSGEAHLAHPRFFVAQPLLGIERFDEAEEMLRSGLRLAESLGLAWSLPLYHSRLVALGFISGDWDGAIAEFEAGQAVADEVGLHVGSVAVSSAWLAAIQLHRDDLEAAERTLTTAMSRLADTGPQLGMGVLNWAQALVLDARQRPDEALALLQVAVDMYKAGAVTDPWSGTAFVRMCVSAGDHERAAALVRVMDGAVGANPLLSAPALRWRGLVEKDADILVRAVGLYRQGHRSLDLAEACEDAAVQLASAGRLGEAVALWDEAIEVYEGLGADRDIARVGADLRQRGIKRGTRRRRVRATTGWESLTGTEHKVVGLVAQPLSNPEVAERLFISRHTVESHLKHIYRKLGLSSRLELAALAVRHAEHEAVET